MNDIDFEMLKKSIAQKTTELSYLQRLYMKETGSCYIPEYLLKQADEDLRNFCTEWPVE